jgi:hypothetical protein
MPSVSPQCQKNINRQILLIVVYIYAIANAVEYSLTGYTGGLHIKFDQKYMIYHFLAFSQEAMRINLRQLNLL